MVETFFFFLKRGGVMNDDEEMHVMSPALGGRQGGVRDRAERDRRDSDDRHAKYYDEPRESKCGNQRKSR